MYYWTFNYKIMKLTGTWKHYLRSFLYEVTVSFLWKTAYFLPPLIVTAELSPVTKIFHMY